MSHVVATIYCNVYRMEFSVKKLLFRTVSTPLLLTAGDEAKGHVRPSSSLRFVQYGLDRGGWLALILRHCRPVCWLTGIEVICT